MKFNWKHSAGAFALSVAMLASTGGQAAPVETGQLLIKDKPIPTSVEKGKSATIPVELPTVDAPSTERGIKDPGVRSCGSCGATGREAAPPPVDDDAAPGSTTAKPKKRKGPKIRDDSVYSTSLRVFGGIVGIAALALAVGSGGDDNPTSP